LQLAIELMSLRLSAQRQAQGLNLVTRREFEAIRRQPSGSWSLCVSAGACSDPIRASRKRNGD
jgi:hypothetical protein